MESLKNLEELKDFFHPGFLIFTNDSDENGIDNRLISIGLRLDMNMSKRESGIWYLKDAKGSLMRYHPVIPNMYYFKKIAEESKLVTRIDFKAGSAPVIHEISKVILDAGYKVGVPNLRAYMDNVAIFTKKDELYVPEKIVEL